MARRADHTRQELKYMALNAATRIVAEEGLSKLSTRKVAKAIGYTVGTIYQLFEDADDMVEQVNAVTLGKLHQVCSDIDFAGGAAASLEEMALRFNSFARNNHRLWSAVIEFQLPDNRSHSESYSRALFGLLGLIEKAIAPFFDDHEHELRLHHARLLWSSYHGIFALAATRSLPKTENVESLADTLIEVHLAALGSRRSVHAVQTA